MSRNPKQYCSQGHDTFIHGKDSNRGCSECRREYGRAWNKSEKAKAYRKNWFERWRKKTGRRYLPSQSRGKYYADYILRSLEEIEITGGGFYFEERLPVDELSTLNVISGNPVVKHQRSSNCCRDSLIAACFIGHRTELERLEEMENNRDMGDYRK